MKVTVEDFKHIPGKNDAEYIELLEGQLERDKQIINKASAKIKQLSKEVPKHGHWAHLGGDEWCCSSCGNVINTEGSWEHPITRDMLFCNHCGALMNGVTE